MANEQTFLNIEENFKKVATVTFTNIRIGEMFTLNFPKGNIYQKISENQVFNQSTLSMETLFIPPTRVIPLIVTIQVDLD